MLYENTPLQSSVNSHDVQGPEPWPSSSPGLWSHTSSTLVHDFPHLYLLSSPPLNLSFECETNYDFFLPVPHYPCFTFISHLVLPNTLWYLVTSYAIENYTDDHLSPIKPPEQTPHTCSLFVSLSLPLFPISQLIHQYTYWCMIYIVAVI
jgi:hypothetical protein